MRCARGPHSEVKEHVWTCSISMEPSYSKSSHYLRNLAFWGARRGQVGHAFEWSCTQAGGGIIYNRIVLNGTVKKAGCDQERCNSSQIVTITDVPIAPKVLQSPPTLFMTSLVLEKNLCIKEIHSSKLFLLSRNFLVLFCAWQYTLPAIKSRVVRLSSTLS